MFNLNADLFLMFLVLVQSVISYHLTPVFTTIYSRKTQDKQPKIIGVLSLTLGFLFWLTHLLAIYSVHLEVTLQQPFLYFLVSYAVCSTIAFFSVRTGGIPSMSSKAYFITGCGMSLGIVLVDFIGYAILFHGQIEVKPLLIFFAVLLSAAFSFSALRLLLIALEDSLVNQRRAKYYRTAGSFIGGVSLAGIPYVIMTSVIDYQLADGGPYHYLLPFLFVFLLNLILTFIPDLYSHTMMNEQSERINEKEERFRSLFHHSPDGVISTDLHGVITSVNKVAAAMTQLPEKNMIGLSFLTLIKESDHQKALFYFSEIVKGDFSENELSVSLQRKNGESLDVLITAVRQVVNHKVVGVYGVVKDVTESKRAQNRINYLAFHDELTGLPNRRFFIQKLSDLKAENQAFAILNLDFDRFKRLNDLFGHAFGDLVLVKIAERLTSVLPEKSILSRLGGDEFSIILLSDDYEAANETANDIVHHFRLPMKIRENDCLVTASIGIAHFPAHSTDAEMLMKFADIAMYDVKMNGSNSFGIYKPEMNDKLIEKIRIENELRKALQYKELSVYFQPKFKENLATVIGAEALVRWKHAELGFISPATFIPIAEETGLIFELERFVLGEVASHVQIWERQNLNFGRVSINISHLHLYQDDLIQTIDEILSSYQIHASSLELEITETAMMDNELEANMKLSKLRSRGIEISMDDFGTGYSSLSYLQKLSIDRLKIDQSFIREMEQHNGNEAIVSMIISMANHLELKVIAEGVETKTQKDLLAKLGCLEFQGYLGGRPIPAEEFSDTYLTGSKAV
ncbi:EAL domain-containing protein [Metabacillus idriensis]|uniref:bifunctional diguanylate cyclase/phosphodiesterase n=1 Tax=Metabacillus idriensis TaxID=324768 RepID=UPI0028143AA8|nr:EAL domain-containing protein [Metabacillus idriensis]MDR0137038.1 EAL domain-containing protein [Metabacillus idriensis]